MNISQKEPPAKASSPAHESPSNETGNPPDQSISPIDPNNGPSLAASSATTTTPELTQPTEVETQQTPTLPAETNEPTDADCSCENSDPALGPSGGTSGGEATNENSVSSTW